MACSSLFKGLSLTTSSVDIVWYSVQYASNMDLISSVVFKSKWSVRMYNFLLKNLNLKNAKM